MIPAPVAVAASSEYPVAEFVLALAVGTVALGIAAAWARSGERAGNPAGVPFIGIATTVTALWVINLERPVGLAPICGITGVAAITAASARSGWRGGPVGAAALATPFAAMLAFDASPIGWIRALVIVGVAVGSVAVARTDAGWSSTGLAPALYASAAAGVFAAVPNTKEAAAVFGASVAGALAGWPLGRARLGAGGSGSATALLVWVVAVDAWGRSPAAPGAMACLGMLVTLSVGRWLVARATGRPARTFGRPIPLLACQAVVLYLASRVAGVSHDLSFAASIAAAAFVLALIAGIAMALDRRPYITPSAGDDASGRRARTTS